MGMFYEHANLKLLMDRDLTKCGIIDNVPF